MVQYATPTELAGFMQQDLDAYTADQALTLASGSFSAAADTWFASQSVTYKTTGTTATAIRLPFRPVIAVQAVRISGTTVTGYTLINRVLYRPQGFGSAWTVPPDLLEVDLTHGFTTVPDDVKKAVLKLAAGEYENPTSAQSESIDDYTVRYDPANKIEPSFESPDTVAARYRGTWTA